MRGIDLNQPIRYDWASFRYFDENECHITRFCPEDVLLLVFDGVLRFSENGQEYEVQAGEYHIQQHDTFQAGEIASSSPKYLFVHFCGEWGETEDVLPFRGRFSYGELKESMQRLDYMSHNDYTLTEQSGEFYRILASLYRKEAAKNVATQIADFVGENYQRDLSLEMLAQEFHFSKNHIINLFKKEYKMTPFEYIRNVRLKKAEWLLEVTPKTALQIAAECGFQDYSCFYKSFLGKNNVSPNEWRTQKRLKPLG